jgi:hypothetical protein
MSSLTKCNFCKLQQRKRRAKESGLTVSLVLSKSGGVDVYEHPTGIEMQGLTHEEREPYWKAWYMKLSNRCAC